VNKPYAPSALRASGACGRRAIALAGGIALLGAMSAMTGVANAQSAVGPVPQPSDSSLTMKGITLYGIVDVGIGYETHGAPFSDYFMASSADLIQKNGNHSAFGVTSSNMSQSRVGLQGIEPLGVGDWFGIFRIETYFNPSSGNISDALKSLTQNNGRALAAQTTNLDSSIAGELFEQAFVGLSSKTFGAATFGRQNTLLADGIGKYDPNGGSQAFSLVGLSGTPAGGGATQNRRVDGSLKYVEAIGPAHFGVMYKFSQSYGAANTAEQFNVGFEYAGLSVDAYYTHNRDAISASALSAAQLATAVAAPYYLSASNSVAGTISDNTSGSILALYNLGFIPLKFYGGFEHIQFGNPKNPLAIGFDDIGGYKLGAVNNAAFPHPRLYNVYFTGAKYTLWSKLDLTGAYYGLHQNNYSAGLACRPSLSSSQCSGDEQYLSVDADYRWSKRFDTYIGAMYSRVQGGRANGYLLATATHPYADDFVPTMGLRFRF
jgi:predicted porin